jgi:dolichol-phosphate mannosyltransferase
MKSKNESIDIVIAIFNEQKNIIYLIQEISNILCEFFQKINFIIVDDGSTDNTRSEIKKIERIKTDQSNVSVKFISFSKNFGKNIAIKCGVDHSTSEICVTIDGDFQHPPEKIIEAYQKLQEGYNIIHIIKKEHNIGPKYRKYSSFFFNRFIDYLSGYKIHLTDFKVIDKKAVEILKKYSESSYYYCGIMEMVGLKSGTIEYLPQARRYGNSKFSFFKLFRLAIANVISVSIMPLRATIFAGLIISIFSLIYGSWILFEKIVIGQPISGFATITVAIFFIGGVQLSFLGIIGEYLGKIFIESKKRPQYIIDHIIDL